MSDISGYSNHGSVSVARWDVVTERHIVKTYHFGGTRVAVSNNGTLAFLHADHLGSASLATTPGGGIVTGSEIRYFPFGETRTGGAGLPTDRRYTGQMEESAVGLYYYVARHYDPAIGRFIQADTIVPDPSQSQDFNRYTYTRNNPVKYNDPTGHYPEVEWWNLPDDTSFRYHSGVVRRWFQNNQQYLGHFGSLEAQEAAFWSAFDQTEGIDNRLDRSHAMAQAMASELTGGTEGLAYQAAIHSANAVLLGSDLLSEAYRSHLRAGAMRTMFVLGTASPGVLSNGPALPDIYNSRGQCLTTPPPVEVRYSEKAIQTLMNPGRYVPRSLLESVVRDPTTVWVPDPQGSPNASMTYVDLAAKLKQRNGPNSPYTLGEYTLEILYNRDTHTIYHFQYYHPD